MKEKLIEPSASKAADLCARPRMVGSALGQQALQFSARSQHTRSERSSGGCLGLRAA